PADVAGGSLFYNMYYVYILLLANGNLYTGSSGNLKRRITYHEFGKVRSTKMYRPVRLIY
ncbi:MAG TPA: GIY-YIG nuclease family protein, partial [Candidatus Andersenbacteria bacterium]|nr:GIY-YIG nuclease family protein [Candidatus Andersenbacteria bacterium]